MMDNATRSAVVVNDDPTQLHLLAGLLRKAGLEPLAFPGAEPALGAMKHTGPPALIITDLHMPDIDGWQFCRLLRSPEYAAFNDVPIAVFSATFSGEDLHHIASDAGANAFIPSPVDGNRFMSQVEALLRGEPMDTTARVLIAESDPAWAAELHGAFAAAGYAVTTARSLKEADEAASKDPYHIAVLNHHLPDGDGGALLDLLRARRPECIRLVMAADPAPELAVEWMKRGAATYARIPCEPAYLIELCVRAQRERSHLRAKEQLEVHTGKLRESEEKYRAIVEQMSDQLFLHDLEGAFVEVNDAATANTGYRREELLQMNVFDLHPDPSDREDIQRQWRMMPQGYLRGLQTEHRRKDGSVYPVELSITKIAFGGAEYILALARDISERLKSERALRKSEERIRRLAEVAPVGVVIADHHDNPLYINATFVELLGYTKEDLPTLDAWWRLAYPDEAQRKRVQQEWAAVVREARKNKIETAPMELPVTCKDGSVRDIEFRMTTTEDLHILILSDITERKRADEALRESEQNLRITLDSIGEAVIATDADGAVTWMNPVAEQLTGWTFEAARGKPLSEVFTIINAETRKPVFNPVERVLETGDTVGLANDTLLVARNGAERQIADSAAPIRSAEGKTTGVVLVFRDVTEEYQMQAKLKENELFLTNVFDSIQDAISVLDCDLNIVRTNKWMTEKYGGDGPIEGKKCYEVYQGRGSVCPWCPTVKAMETGQPHSAEVPFPNAEEPAGWIDLSAFPLKNDNGSVTGVIEYVKDITDRKRAEEALRESERKHRRLIESLPDIVQRVDRDARYLFVSSNIVEWTGVKADEFIGKTDRELGFDEETCRFVEKAVQRVFERGAPYEREFSTDTTKGPTIFNVRCMPERDEQGVVQSALILCRDITAHRKTEQEFGMLFEQMVEAFAVHEIICDADGEPVDYRFLAVNPAFEQMTGMDASETVGKTVREVLPNTEPYWIETYGRVALTGEPIYFEQYARELGKHYEVTAFRPAPGQFACIFMDVTPRKQAEAELQQFKRIFDTANYGMAIAKLDGTITHINDYFAATHGYDASELIGQSVKWLHNDEQHEIVDRLLAQLRTEGEFGPIEVPHCRRDGTVFSMLMAGQILRDSEGAPQALAATAIDISELKSLESQLQRAQRMESVGRLAGGVAHDYNNMLSVIIGYMDLVMAQLDSSHPISGPLQEVRKAADRSANLTRQLLAFARQQAIEPMVLDLNEAVTNMLKMLKRLIGEDVELRWIPREDLWAINVDPSQVDQILANLCVNAKDAIAGVGVITIETANATITESDCHNHLHGGKDIECIPGEYVMLSVSDDGCGMDRATQENMFEPFFSTKEQGKGTGLGLPTVHGIVKQNNGIINVYSEPGKGTSLKVYLPRYTGVDESKGEDAAVEASCEGHETILVVEDEPAILQVTCAILKRGGYTVLAAETPSEALRITGEHAGAIHLLISDVVMPEMSGWELAEQLTMLNPELKYMFMSGYPHVPGSQSEPRHTDAPFLQKPFTAANLMAKVREVLDQR